MKPYLISFVIVLCCTTIYTNAPATNPKPIKVQLNDIDMKYGLHANREDAMVGDFAVVDAAKEYRGATQVKDTAQCEDVDFPQYGRF